MAPNGDKFPHQIAAWHGLLLPAARTQASTGGDGWAIRGSFPSKHGEAVFSEPAKVEAAKNTTADLTGKLEAMQAQIQMQADELDATRQNAAALRSKVATKSPKAPSKE